MFLTVLGIIAAVVILLLLLCTLACGISSYFLVEKAFGRYTKPEHTDHFTERSRWELYANANERGREYIEKLQTAKTLEITSRDGLRLRAIYIPAERPNGSVVIAIHGHHSTNLRNMAMFAQYYHEHGFELIMPDMRGCGESEGHWLGFSYLDRLDVCDWAKKAVEMFGEECRILLHGVSMGASSVVSASGTGELPRQVRGAVSDCGFSSSYKEFRNTLALRTKLPAYLFLPVLSFVMRVRIGYSLRDAEPVRFLKDAKIPFLFIHGDADDYVETAMAVDFARACPTKYKLLIFEGAYHSSAYPSDKERYERALDGFWRGVGC